MATGELIVGHKKFLLFAQYFHMGQFSSWLNDNGILNSSERISFQSKKFLQSGV